ncbi:ATP-binding protein [Hydrogenophaga sp.]|uniref:ATP-binding protein n=1 Tax=Hydrogenophaga sp. TaxID=1904254 RepID=UPI002735AC8E|nr:ATP-binding protein [Hydrogenophaga sp.]MDP3474768.1 ATP-binding protein [Hydrogenophaga sp.]
MAEVTAEQVQRGRGPDPTALARRKLVTREVKSVRERLTSSTGLERAFDNELLRVFAEYRMNGSVGTLVLTLAVAAAACLWVPVYKVTPWVGAVLLATMIIVVLSRRFLALATSDIPIRPWRRAFALAEGFHGLSWALMLLVFAQIDAPGAKVFVTTTLLIVSALTVMLAASIPMAVYAGILPIVIGIAAFFWGRTDMDSLTTAVMAACAQLFFVFLANRLYASSVSTIAFRAEKDALIAELETANANSDEARRKAEEANLAKSRFLATMSHELRTPLNAILGFAQLVESGTPAPTPTQKRGIDQILKAGWYLLDLINEILDLALIESGTLSLSGEPVSLAEVLLECRAMVEDQARQRGIGMTFARLEAPRFVKADRTRLKQVLINLLFNAIKYNQSGGHVTVVCTLSAQERVRISVRDTGPGLTTVQLGQLFQPFNRLGQESGGEEGTGIGLVVTKRLVELMGGLIGVESTPGVGSVFWVEMPLTAAPQSLVSDALALDVPRTEAPLGAPQHTVLYVEDNPANLELVELIVARRPDLRLLGAADASVGIEFARVYQPEVILMDINLPGISGVEAMKILRADPSTAHIPIIALSANAVPRDIARAMAAGFFNYITKPIQVNQFMEALDQALAFAQTDRGTALTKEPA